jgi:hypothetical protein
MFTVNEGVAEFPAATAVTTRPEGFKATPRVDDDAARVRRRPQYEEITDQDRDDAADDEEYEDRARRRKRRASRREAASFVAVPAIGLMIVGGLTMLVAAAALLLFLTVAVLGGPPAAAGADDLIDAVSGAVTAVLCLCWGVVVISGGWKLYKLSDYAHAMTASIIAMLPCSVCWLGLPFGLWALILLCQPEVKAAFR